MVTQLTETQFPDLLIADGDTPLTTSLMIAERYGRAHRTVLQAIDDAISKNDDQEFIGEHIKPTYLEDRYGRPLRAYLLTEVGYFIVVAGFTGAEAINLRTRFAKAFEEMRTYIQNDIRNKALAEGKDIGYESGMSTGTMTGVERLKQFSIDQHKLKWQLEIKEGRIAELEKAIAEAHIKPPPKLKLKMPPYVCEEARTIGEIAQSIVDMDNNPYVSSKGISATALRVLVVDKSAVEKVPISNVTSALKNMGYEYLGRVRVKGGEKHALWTLKSDTRQETSKIYDFKNRVEQIDLENLI